MAADAGLEAAPALTMVAASEALLRGACSVLSARGALTLHHGAFVKACLGRLAALLTLLNTSAAGKYPYTTEHTPTAWTAVNAILVPALSARSEFNPVIPLPPMQSMQPQALLWALGRGFKDI